MILYLMNVGVSKNRCNIAFFYKIFLVSQVSTFSAANIHSTAKIQRQMLFSLNLFSVPLKTLLPRLTKTCFLRYPSISGAAFHEKHRLPLYFSLVIFRHKQRNDSIHNFVIDNKTYINCGIHSNHVPRYTEIEKLSVKFLCLLALFNLT